MQATDSPAKQFLLALAKASEALEASIENSCEEALKLNEELIRFVEERLEESDRGLEIAIAESNTCLQMEREGVLKELAQVRQEELLILFETGKAFRETLKQKINEHVGLLEKEIETQVDLFQTNLTQIEAGLDSKISNLRKDLNLCLEEHSCSIEDQVNNQKQNVQDLTQEYRVKMTEFLDSVNKNLDENRSLLSERMLQETVEIVKKLDLTVQEKTTSSLKDLEEKLSNLFQYVDNSKIYLDKLSQSDMTQILELPEKFKKSSGEMSTFLVGMHSTAATNLAVQCRTELLSRAQAAEDQLRIVKSELQASLVQFQDVYSERIRSLLTRFETNCIDLISMEKAQLEAKQKVELGEEDELNLKQFFYSLRKLTSDGAKTKLMETEKNIESHYDDGREFLEEYRKKLAVQIESQYTSAHDTAMKLLKKFELDTSQLNIQIQALESDCSELQELLNALSQPGWD